LKPVGINEVAIFSLCLTGEHKRFFIFLIVVYFACRGFFQLLKVLSFHKLIVFLEDAQDALKFLDSNKQFLFSNFQFLVLDVDVFSIFLQLSLRTLNLEFLSDKAHDLFFMQKLLETISKVGYLGLSIA
jgi:hypothetical protein